MKITKVINNNVVSSMDEAGNEVILMGTGLGFKGKPGSPVDDSKIQKVFHMEDPGVSQRFKELITDLPMELLQTCSDIIMYAKGILNTKLNENIYITLTDHINFALQRMKQDMMYPNPLSREVKTFYDLEYKIGEYALGIVEKDLGVRLPQDEAVSIALHVVSAEYDTKVRDTVQITTFIKNVIDKVKDYFHMELTETSLNYERFITHLKFLSRKVMSGGGMDEIEPELKKMISAMYPDEYQCSKEIADYIKKEYRREMSEGEIVYLTMHIERIKSSNQTKSINK
ncbi:BglG family transcription antiterminator LicT [Anaerostipes sp.]|uniref:BglG family transcription antiterminator LicT n=1 Tax=Anaerostipes sp. TaxID=1872530 RepID=UPI0025C25DE3|nr:PRD domain-containing protein [Anaerostipes sp.]MBS7008440.1 PRD domain-containing protein [Anaerostipes sp.]